MLRESIDDSAVRGTDDSAVRGTKVDTNLPSKAILRWTPWRKRSVVLAVREGAMSTREAGERYMLSQEELASWIRDFERRGVAGLMLKTARCGNAGGQRPKAVTILG
jgi:hypothetical protein